MEGDEARVGTSMTFISRKEDTFNGDTIQNIGKRFTERFESIAKEHNCYIGVAYVPARDNGQVSHISVKLTNLRDESIRFMVEFIAINGSNAQTSSVGNPFPSKVEEFERVAELWNVAADVLLIFKNTVPAF